MAWHPPGTGYPPHTGYIPCIAGEGHAGDRLNVFSCRTDVALTPQDLPLQQASTFWQLLLLAYEC